MSLATHLPILFMASASSSRDPLPRRERRSRSKSPPRQKVTIETANNKVYEIVERRGAKPKRAVEAAERRRGKDVALEGAAGALAPQKAGRPPKSRQPGIITKRSGRAKRGVSARPPPRRQRPRRPRHMGR